MEWQCITESHPVFNFQGAQRELTSVLLSDLYGERVIYEQDIELGIFFI